MSKKQLLAEVKQILLSESKEVAQEILRQLGGNKFLAMTGAKNLSFGSNPPALNFALPKAMNKIKYITVILNGLDTYDVKYKDKDGATIKEDLGLYNDMLQNAFTKATGLYTHL